MDGLTVVSNRLPVVLHWDAAAERWTFERGSGGLVQALEPVLQRLGGRWVGWPGIAQGDSTPELPLDEVSADAGYELTPVGMDADEVAAYYGGFANSVLWPLFHGLAERCDFRPEFWDAYERVNERFADVLVNGSRDDDELYWIHDYHLIKLADGLRRRGHRGRIGFFLHTPFPTLQDFVKLPWREGLLRAFLAHDLIGFQTERDRKNFLDCVERLDPGARVIREDSIARIRLRDRNVWIGVFPIGIDYGAIDRRARGPEVGAWLDSLRRSYEGQAVILGCDRLDYTKGLPERLRAYDLCLERHPELVGKVVLLQVLVPSRESVPEYQQLKRQVDGLVGNIAGRFATPYWEPVRYLYDHLGMDELVALYRLADVALVTPICDGMNLVAKEYCGAHVDESGVLVLGEMAGAAAQLQNSALLVNPFDVEGTARAIQRAVTMGSAERAGRMREARSVIESSDVFWWAKSFLDALREPSEAGDFGQIEYLPRFDIGRREQRPRYLHRQHDAGAGRSP